ASKIFAGLDGMERMLEPGPSADTPYEAQAQQLPKTLDEALRALRNDTCLTDGFGRPFIDYYLRIKDAEIARYQAEVTEWEQREYFELFCSHPCHLPRKEVEWRALRCASASPRNDGRRSG